MRRVGGVLSRLGVALQNLSNASSNFLVLEEDDLWLTNHFLVSDALAQAETSMPDAPDEVFLVTTCNEQTWPVSAFAGPGMSMTSRCPTVSSIQMNLRN